MFGKDEAEPEGAFDTDIPEFLLRIAPGARSDESGRIVPVPGRRGQRHISDRRINQDIIGIYGRRIGHVHTGQVRVFSRFGFHLEREILQPYDRLVQQIEIVSGSGGQDGYGDLRRIGLQLADRVRNQDGAVFPHFGFILGRMTGIRARGNDAAFALQPDHHVIAAARTLAGLHDQVGPHFARIL